LFSIKPLKEIVLNAILCWEIGNMVLYTPVAMIGMFYTIGLSTGLFRFGDGAGMGIAMIIDICMIFYHGIFTTSGLYIISMMKIYGRGSKDIYNLYLGCIIFRAIALLIALLIATLGIMSEGAEMLPTFMAIGYVYHIPEYVFLCILKSEINKEE